SGSIARVVAEGRIPERGRHVVLAGRQPVHAELADVVRRSATPARHEAPRSLHVLIAHRADEHVADWIAELVDDLSGDRPRACHPQIDVVETLSVGERDALARTLDALLAPRRAHVVWLGRNHRIGAGGEPVEVVPPFAVRGAVGLLAVTGARAYVDVR